MRREDEYVSAQRVARADVEAEVVDILDYLTDNADALGVDLATIEIVRLRVAARFGSVDDDEDA